MVRIKTSALIALSISVFLIISSSVTAEDLGESDAEKLSESDIVDNLLLEDKGKLKLDELEQGEGDESENNLNDDLEENKADNDVEELQVPVYNEESDVDVFDKTDPSNDDPRPVPAEGPADAPAAPPMAARGAKNGRLTMSHYDPNSWDSLLSDFAPPDTSQRGGGLPYIITEQRLKEIREPLMYWYWDQGGSSENIGDYQRHIHESTKTVHKNLNFQLPFFGFRFNYTRVSLNGMLEFSDPPQMYPSYPLTFPNKLWPKENDPSFIGIFMSSIRVGATRAEDRDQRRPGVYFRLERDLQTRTDIIGVEMRERIKWDIRKGVIGAETFLPKHVITATWKNVTFAGGITQSIHKTNTFQIVLATDEVFTYCIFNYLDLQWTSHTSAGGDTLGGEGGTAAFVGFNAGNGTRSYEYLPYSQGTVIRDLTGRGWGNGKNGRHIFRIDEKILPGSCNKDIDGANMQLNFAPESGNMLGGTVVNITGPCFEPNDRIKCKFDVMDEIVGTVVDRNRAICVQPMLYAEGYVLLQIALNSDMYKWKGRYYVETPGSAAEKIYFLDGSVHEKKPSEIKITWAKYNLTTNENSPVRISLWGYRETTIRPEFLYIDTLSEGQSNSGDFVIVPGNFRNRDNRQLADIKFGFIQINLTDSIQVEQEGGANYQFEITPVIWSRPVPLGWYFESQWERLYGPKWTEQLCNDWIMKDRFLKNFAHELTQCPCSIEHAVIDKGRFLPDADCDKDANPKCPYHRGALHCVRTGIPTMEGSEQQCCYDKMGYLMMSYDQQWGSTPRRSHNLGYLPHNEANKVPTLSHWFHDMVPKYLCCRWQEEQSVGCETLRFERRPTQDCVAYQPPAIAGVFGDPHIVTFDDVRYTFNGKGEFVLVRTDDKTMSLDVQGRFEQMPMNAYGEVKATQLTSVVVRGNGTDPAIIEVRQRPEEARWRYRLEVLANGQPVYFDRPSLKFQHFAGATVYTPTYILNQSEVIVMLDSGAGVEVVENRGYMSARVFLPWTYINKTRGLFGNWSFDMNDDLVKPDGTILPVSANVNDFRTIYTEFGLKWILEQQSVPGIGGSLFTYENGKSSSHYNNRSFEPEFRTSPNEILFQNLTVEINKAHEYCHETYQCLYDYAMTLSKDQAHFTTNYLSTIVNWKQRNTKTVVSCGVLETPRFGRKSNFLFIPGTKVTFECNQGFILVGDQRRECTSDGHWDYPMYGYTECLREQEYSSRFAGLTFGIILAVMIPIILGLVYAGYKFIQKRNQENELDEEDEIRRRAQEAAALKMRVISETDSDPKGTMRMNDFDNNQSQYGGHTSQYAGDVSTYGKNQSTFGGNQSPYSGTQEEIEGNSGNREIYDNSPQQQQQQQQQPLGQEENRVNSPVSQSARTTEIY